MAINSRNKGKRGELSLKTELLKHGIVVQRGCSFIGQPDIVGLNGIHVECKAVEKLNVWQAMEQAERDVEKMQDGVPAVFHKKNRTGFLVTMKLEDWIKMYKETSYVQGCILQQTQQEGRSDSGYGAESDSDWKGVEQARDV